jgi:hypothetical protein
MHFIYVNELHEESPMDKKHRKREKEVYTEIPTLIYMASCREVKGRESVRERDQISNMNIGGDILTGGVTFFFPMMSKRKKEKD